MVKWGGIDQKHSIVAEFLDRPVRFAATRMLSVRTSSSSSGVQGAKLLGKRRMRDSS